MAIWSAIARIGTPVVGERWRNQRGARPHSAIPSSWYVSSSSSEAKRPQLPRHDETRTKTPSQLPPSR
eukprot:6856263-Prymnesium_polylepis.1